MTRVSANWYHKLLLGSLTWLTPACGNGQQPAVTPSMPSSIAPPAPIATSPSPAALPTDPYQKGIDKATSAQALAQDAQTPEDWKLVVTQWQRAIAFLKAVPRSSRNYGAAQKLLVVYQRELARTQQIAKQDGSSPSTQIAKDTSKGGIPLIVGGTPEAGVDVVNAVTTLNQQQIEFFARQKRFAANLAELNATIPDNSSYLYKTVGDGKNRAISTAVAKQDGLTSYSGSVFVVKDAKNNETTVAIVCVTAQPSKTPPAALLQGKTAVCPAGSSRLG
ncbi:MAG: type IV pilin-like G/H family protein [Kovacikia sp.]